MKHWYVTSPRTLTCIEEPIPAPGENEVLVRMAYTALSPGSNVHVFQTGGYGADSVPERAEVLYMGSGVVEAVGAGVHDALVGSPVAVLGPGHQAYVVLPVDQVFPAPSGLSLRDASLAYLSTWSVSALHLGGYAAAETVVVIGLGLVGASASLVAEMMGARVLGLDTSPERVAFARRLGLGRVESPEAATEIEDYLGAAGPDLIIETSGNWHGFRQAVALARDYTRVAVMGIYRQPPPADLGMQLFSETFGFPSKFHYRRLQIIGCGSDPGSLAEPMPRTATRGRNFAYVLEQAARGRLPLGKLITDTAAPEDIEQVLRRLAAGDRSMLGVVFDWQAS